METDLDTYYRRRASEYDEVYRKPERQSDIADLAGMLTRLLSRRRVLEVAAGTGFWIEAASRSAESIVATDVADETLDVARRRSYYPANVHFANCDAFSLDEIRGNYDAGLVCFWLSHLRQDRMSAFLDHLNVRLEPDSLVLVADNRYVAGSNHAITRTDSAGNTYQQRRSDNGESYEILKNFPEPDDLTGLVRSVGSTQAEVINLQYYWLLKYRTGL